MRKRVENDQMSVRAIAGTEVVLLAFDAPEKKTRGLLGFQLSKRKGPKGKFRPMRGGRDFEGVKSATPVIQTFLWGDYVVNPNTSYTYRCTPVYGKPAKPRKGKTLQLTIKTEDPTVKTHGIYFNRGAAGSQAYSRRFGKYRRWFKEDASEEDPKRMRFKEFLRPQDVPNRAAYKWLSRGLEEAMLGFIGQANGPRYSIRAALYELTHDPAVEAFVAALESGADVKIVHHSKRQGISRLKTNKATITTVSNKDGSGKPVTYNSREVVREKSPDSVTKAANKTVARAGISHPKHLEAFSRMLIPRIDTTISHNKFIVLLEDGEPIQVWTGSTNLTPGGIFGQANVGHLVRDPEVARKYHEYWQKLSTDPPKRSKKADPPDTGIKNWTVSHQPDLTGPPPPNSMTPIFSPRLSKAMLEWYADRLGAARNSVFFTAAFSVAEEIYTKVSKTKRIQSGEPYLRYLLLEGNTGLLRPKIPAMQKIKQNHIAWGDTRREPGGADKRVQFIETLTGLNDHVNYLHTKYMMIDPLSDDPIVMSGSANYSKASTVNNDENMLVIRGNTRVADIFLGEFMRLFNHFHSRNEENKLSDKKAERDHYLRPDSSWTRPYYTEGTQEQSERLLFS